MKKIKLLSFKDKLKLVELEYKSKSEGFIDNKLFWFTNKNNNKKIKCFVDIEEEEEEEDLKTNIILYRLNLLSKLKFNQINVNITLQKNEDFLLNIEQLLLIRNLHLFKFRFQFFDISLNSKCLTVKLSSYISLEGLYRLFNFLKTITKLYKLNFIIRNTSYFIKNELFDSDLLHSLPIPSKHINFVLDNKLWRSNYLTIVSSINDAIEKFKQRNLIFIILQAKFKKNLFFKKIPLEIIKYILPKFLIQ